MLIATKIMVDRFVGGSIFAESAALIEKILMEGAIRDKILTCQNPLFLTETNSLAVFHYST